MATIKIMEKKNWKGMTALSLDGSRAFLEV
jgi:hypothetical protein